MAPVVRFVEFANGVGLPYAEQGDPSGVPMVLLHGFVDSWRSFELVLPHLPTFIRAIAPTQRGHGDASRPASGYRESDLSQDLGAFMDALGVESAVLVGASSGGLVAQRFALDHAERTLGLVLLGSPVTLCNKPAVREWWDSTVSRLTDPIDPDFVRAFQGSTLARPVPPAFFDAMMAESLKVPARVWRAMTEGFLSDDHSSELHRIAAPTLILWGDQDVLTQGDQEALRAAIAGSRLVVYEGAGHTLYWEEPARVAHDLVAFVETITSGRDRKGPETAGAAGAADGTGA